MALHSLMYHAITPAAPADRYAVSFEDFSRHLEAIRRGAPAASGFALTFDDGHPGWLRAAVRLSGLGWKASFFVVTRAIGRPGELTKGDLRELAALGHVVGTHTVDHPADLAQRDEAFIRAQWRDSKAFLEDVLGAPVFSGSVPGGSYASRVGRAAQSEGLSGLFTSEPVSRPWKEGACEVYGRYTVLNGMSPALVAALAAGSPIVTAAQWAAWNAKRALKKTLIAPLRRQPTRTS